MATESYQVQLERVQARIAELEASGSAQSYSIAGRSKTNPELATLYEREKYLRTMADRETRGGIRGRLATPV